MGQFRTVYNCLACKQGLTLHQVMYSLGTCPKCGTTSDGTVVSAVKTSVYVPGFWERLFGGKRKS